MACKKRVVLSVEQRVDICKRAEMGENVNKIAAEYGIHANSVSRIKGQKLHLLKYAEDKKNNWKKMRDPRLHKLDQALFAWYVERCNEGDIISGPVLAQKAIRLNQDLDGPADFTASNGWLDGFKSRHRIRFSSSQQGEASPQCADAPADHLPVQFASLLHTNNINLANVYSMRETRMLWKSLPEANNQDRVALGVCGNATGSHKIPLIFVHKYENPRALRHVQNTLPVQYYPEEKARITINIVADWYTNIFVPSVLAHQARTGKNGKVLLLLANHSAYSTAKLPRVEGFEISPMPPALAHSMDQSVIVALKTRYRKRIFRRIFDYPLGVQEFLAKVDIKDCMDMVAESWRDEAPINIANSWDALLKDKDKDKAQSLLTQHHVSDERNSLLEAAQEVFPDITEQEVDEWLRHCENAEKDDDENVPVAIKQEDVDSSLSSEIPFESRVLGRERIEELMRDLEFWSRGQPDHIRFHAQSLISWHAQ